MNKALQTEYGGNHYQNYKVQPIELIAECGWDFFQGNIAKYVLRHQYKNGAEDLKKAIHYCELAIGFGYNQQTDNYRFVEPRVSQFCIENDIKSDAIRYILLAIGNKKYEIAKKYIAELLRITY